MRRRRRRFDDDEYERHHTRPRPGTRHEVTDAGDDAVDPDGPPDGDRWSTWTDVTAGQRGPEPWPDWLVTDAGAVDRELGVLKTGKEADVHLLERGVPGTDRAVLLAAKRYRGAEHRMFHRDAGYLEGAGSGGPARRGRWEREALCRLHAAGVAVPFPVQCDGTEVLMEFLGNRTGRARRACPACVRTRTSSVICGTSSARPSARWPTSASRTATCPPTTCRYTADG